MEKIINSIIDIDKKTKKLNLETEAVIKNRNLDLKEKINNLEKQSTLEAKTISEDLYKKIIKDGEDEILYLETKDYSSLKKIEDIYNNKKEDLVENIFKSLFLLKE